MRVLVNNKLLNLSNLEIRELLTESSVRYEEWGEGDISTDVTSLFLEARWSTSILDYFKRYLPFYSISAPIPLIKAWQKDIRHIHTRRLPLAVRNDSVYRNEMMLPNFRPSENVNYREIPLVQATP